MDEEPAAVDEEPAAVDEEPAASVEWPLGKLGLAAARVRALGEQQDQKIITTTLTLRSEELSEELSLSKK